MAGEGRLKAARRRQSERWVVEAFRERYGQRGLQRLQGAAMDGIVSSDASPFERLRQLSEILERPR
jgi:hypothetical protein